MQDMEGRIRVAYLKAWIRLASKENKQSLQFNSIRKSLIQTLLEWKTTESSNNHLSPCSRWVRSLMPTLPNRTLPNIKVTSSTPQLKWMNKNLKAIPETSKWSKTPRPSNCHPYLVSSQPKSNKFNLSPTLLKQSISKPKSSHPLSFSNSSRFTCNNNICKRPVISKLQSKIRVCPLLISLLTNHLVYLRHWWLSSKITDPMELEAWHLSSLRIRWTQWWACLTRWWCQACSILSSSSTIISSSRSF